MGVNVVYEYGYGYDTQKIVYWVLTGDAKETEQK